ncbi:hypothetical protein EC968_009755 [Mortierella alpina]|nr:hypothetical protein EC968_009755 [Mortierella alpina]
MTVAVKLVNQELLLTLHQTTQHIPFQEFSRIKYNAHVPGRYDKIHTGRWRDQEVEIQVPFGEPTTVEKKIRLLQRLSSCPQVLHLHGYTIDPATSQPYLILQHNEHGTLHSYLRNFHAHLTWSDRFNLAMDIALGVRHLHHKGIRHRHLHSASIFIDSNGSAVLSDFGIGRDSEVISSKEHPTRMAYLAPERLSKGSDRYSNECDIYSLGVVFWEISSGRPPYQDIITGANVQSGALAQLAQNIVSGRRERPIPGTDPIFEDLYNRCWHPIPEERPPIEWIIQTLGVLLKQPTSAILRQIEELSLEDEPSVAAYSFKAHPPPLNSNRDTMMTIKIGRSPSLEIDRDVPESPMLPVSPVTRSRDLRLSPREPDHPPPPPSMPPPIPSISQRRKLSAAANFEHPGLRSAPALDHQRSMSVDHPQLRSAPALDYGRSMSAEHQTYRSVSRSDDRPVFISAEQHTYRAASRAEDRPTFRSAEHPPMRPVEHPSLRPTEQETPRSMEHHTMRSVERSALRSAEQETPRSMEHHTMRFVERPALRSPPALDYGRSMSAEHHTLRSAPALDYGRSMSVGTHMHTHGAPFEHPALRSAPALDYPRSMSVSSNSSNGSGSSGAPAIPARDGRRISNMALHAPKIQSSEITVQQKRRSRRTVWDACQEGSADVAEWCILNTGTSPDELSSLPAYSVVAEVAPVHVVCFYQPEKILDVLLCLERNNANMELQTTETKQTALHILMEHATNYERALEAARYLILECKLSVNVQDHRGLTPFHKYIKNPLLSDIVSVASSDLYKLLKERGQANLSLESQNEGNALGLTGRYLRVDLMKLFLLTDIACSDPKSLAYAASAIEAPLSDSRTSTTAQEQCRLVLSEWKGDRGEKKRVQMAERILKHQGVAVDASGANSPSSTYNILTGSQVKPPKKQGGVLGFMRSKDKDKEKDKDKDKEKDKGKDKDKVAKVEAAQTEPMLSNGPNEIEVAKAIMQAAVAKERKINELINYAGF